MSPITFGDGDGVQIKALLSFAYKSSPSTCTYVQRCCTYVQRCCTYVQRCCTYVQWCCTYVQRCCTYVHVLDLSPNTYGDSLQHLVRARTCNGDGEAAVTSVGLSKPDTLVFRFCFTVTVHIRFAFVMVTSVALCFAPQHQGAVPLAPKVHGAGGSCKSSTCTYVQHRR